MADSPAQESGHSSLEGAVTLRSSFATTVGERRVRRSMQVAQLPWKRGREVRDGEARLSTAVAAARSARAILPAIMTRGRAHSTSDVLQERVTTSVRGRVHGRGEPLSTGVAILRSATPFAAAAAGSSACSRRRLRKLSAQVITCVQRRGQRHDTTIRGDQGHSARPTAWQTNPRRLGPLCWPAFACMVICCSVHCGVPPPLLARVWV